MPVPKPPFEITAMSFTDNSCFSMHTVSYSIIVAGQCGKFGRLLLLIETNLERMFQELNSNLHTSKSKVFRFAVAAENDRRPHWESE